MSPDGLVSGNTAEVGWKNLRAACHRGGAQARQAIAGFLESCVLFGKAEAQQTLAGVIVEERLSRHGGYAAHAQEFHGALLTVLARQGGGVRQHIIRALRN